MAGSSRRIRIGEMLVAAGMLKQDDLERALAEQKAAGGRLGDVLVRLGLIGEIELTQALSNQLSVPWVSLYHVEFSRELLNLVPAELAENFCLVPVYVRTVRGQGPVLFVAMDDPSNLDALEAVAQESLMPTRPMVAAPSDIRNAIRVYYGRSAPPVPPRPPGSPRPDAAIPVRQDERAGPPVRGSAASVRPPPALLPAKSEQISPATSKGHHRGQPGGAGKTPMPRMVTLTLLDGTKVNLPAKKMPADAVALEASAADQALTAKDLVAALHAAAQGADVNDVLPDRRWEAMFATLLSILIRKGLIADWEFVEEWTRRQRETDER